MFADATATTVTIYFAEPDITITVGDTNADGFRQLVSISVDDQAKLDARAVRLVESAAATKREATGHAKRPRLEVLARVMAIATPTMRRTATACRNWRRAA